MTQKLLIIERDTKKELRDAIIKNILEHKSNMRLVSFSVLEQIRSTQYNVISISLQQSGVAPKHTYYYEAWCVVAVPDETDEYYDDLTGMSE